MSDDGVLRTVPDDAEEAYVEGGGVRCPCCGSSYIEGRSVDVDDGSASQRVYCVPCGLSWVDVYILSRMEIDGIPRIVSKGAQ